MVTQICVRYFQSTDYKCRWFRRKKRINLLNEKVAVKKKDVFGGIGTVKWVN